MSCTHRTKGELAVVEVGDEARAAGSRRGRGGEEALRTDRKASKALGRRRRRRGRTEACETGGTQANRASGIRGGGARPTQGRRASPASSRMVGRGQQFVEAGAGPPSGSILRALVAGCLLASTGRGAAPNWVTGRGTAAVRAATLVSRRPAAGDRGGRAAAIATIIITVITSRVEGGMPWWVVRRRGRSSGVRAAAGGRASEVCSIKAAAHLPNRVGALRSKDAELSRELEGVGPGEAQSLEGHECALSDNARMPEGNNRDVAAVQGRGGRGAVQRDAKRLEAAFPRLIKQVAGVWGAIREGEVRGVFGRLFVPLPHEIGIIREGQLDPKQAHIRVARAEAGGGGAPTLQLEEVRAPAIAGDKIARDSVDRAAASGVVKELEAPARLAAHRRGNQLNSVVVVQSLRDLDLPLHARPERMAGVIKEAAFAVDADRGARRVQVRAVGATGQGVEAQAAGNVPRSPGHCVRREVGGARREHRRVVRSGNCSEAPSCNSGSLAYGVVCDGLKNSFARGQGWLGRQGACLIEENVSDRIHRPRGVIVVVISKRVAGRAAGGRRAGGSIRGLHSPCSSLFSKLVSLLIAANANVGAHARDVNGAGPGRDGPDGVSKEGGVLVVLDLQGGVKGAVDEVDRALAVGQDVQVRVQGPEGGGGRRVLDRPSEG